MTTTRIANLINGFYEILKGCTIREIEAMIRVYEDEQTASWHIAVHCCNEAIRRKVAGVWE